MKFKKKIENRVYGMSNRKKKMRGRDRSCREDRGEGKIRIFIIISDRLILTQPKFRI